MSHCFTWQGLVLLDHLEVAKLIVQRVEKYLLSPGLLIDARVQIKITASDVLMVRVLTPEVEIDADSGRVVGGDGDTQSAVRIEAELSMLDLFKDSIEIGQRVKELRRVGEDGVITLP